MTEFATTLTAEALAATIRGALEVSVEADGVRPWRLPATRRRYAVDSLVLMSAFTTGVRLRLITAAQRVTIEASVDRLLPVGRPVPNVPASFVATAEGRITDRVDLVETGLIRERIGEEERAGTSPVTIELRLDPVGSRERLVEVWLPQDAAVLLHRVTADAPLAPAEPPDGIRWLHYGSSISQGGSADGPLGPWPRRAAELFGTDVDSVNLGFGGNAMLDPCVARAIADIPSDVITLEVGINIVGADTMRLRSYLPALHGFLDTIRDTQPTTPIIVMTAFACAAVEDTPGPIRAGVDGRATGTPRARAGDGVLTLSGIRSATADAVARRAVDDPAIFLADGTALLGLEEERYLPDGLHPSPDGHELIARRFVAAASDDTDPGLGAAFHRARLSRTQRGPGSF